MQRKKQPSIATKTVDPISGTAPTLVYTLSQAAMLVGLSVAILRQCAAVLHKEVPVDHPEAVFAEEHLGFLRLAKHCPPNQIVQTFSQLAQQGLTVPSEGLPTQPNRSDGLAQLSPTPPTPSWIIQCSEVVTVDPSAQAGTLVLERSLGFPQQFARQDKPPASKEDTTLQVVMALAEAFAAQCLMALPGADYKKGSGWKARCFSSGM